jgi:hypothetical protein
VEPSTFRRAVVAAACLLALGLALVLLALAGKASLEASLSGVTLLLAGIGLLGWVGSHLWAVMRCETVAYRVLYHAEQQPDGKAIARMLHALARNAGPVSIVWRFQSVAAGARGAAAALAQGELPSKHNGSAEGKASPASRSGSPSPGISLRITAPATARNALEGMLPNLLPGVWAERCEEPEPLKPSSHGRAVYAWRWPIPYDQSGRLADPFACGAHLAELAAGIGSARNGSTEPTEIEIRLRLWPRGGSAVVAAECLVADRSLHTTNLTSTPEAGSSSSPPFPPFPFLVPLLPRWEWRRSGAFVRRTKSACRWTTEESHQSCAQRQASYPVFTGTLSRLVAVLAARYPLWEPFSAPRHAGKRQNGEDADKDGGGNLATSSSRLAGTEGQPGLLFPPTTGFYWSLDSVAAGEIPPPAAYILPPVPSQVLVLGRATEDGRPVGVPALRRSHSAPAKPASSTAPAPQGNTDTLLPDERLHRPMQLHPMLSEHILVVGGSDAWRRDVSGSLVAQALAMRMTVVAVDGGAAPDEPSASDRTRARIVPTDFRGHKFESGATDHHKSVRAVGSDPLLPAMLRLSDSASGTRRVPQIDMDNPAGSLRPNILYMAAPAWLPPAQGEAFAALQALRAGLHAQMRFLQAVNVTGIDDGLSGISAAEVAAAGAGGEGGPGMTLVEAWLIVLLLRHHRARLLLASRGMVLPLESTGSPDASYSTGSSASTIARLIPACPDLPSLMLVLEQSETLSSLLLREGEAWSDPSWIGLLRNEGGILGEEVVHAAQEALERALSVAHMDPSDMFMYGAALRGQLKRILGHPAMIRMLRSPHVSMADLFHGGATRMLRVNLSGAYRTAALPYSDDDLARKHYGLYLLWSLWAASQQREALSVYEQQKDEFGRVGHAQPYPVHPVLLLLHGAGAWFGSGSPLAEAAKLRELGHERSGIAVAVTASGLRHLRAYRAKACEAFGTLVMGPAPVADLEAPDVILDLVNSEVSLLREGMRHLASHQVSETGDASSRPGDVLKAGQMHGADGGDRLLDVLRRTDEGTALVVTGMPGGAKALCTAQTGSGVASDVRSAWLSSGAMPDSQGGSTAVPSLSSAPGQQESTGTPRIPPTHGRNSAEAPSP